MLEMNLEIVVKVVIVLGAPGSGKGTQCRELSRSTDLPVVSSGEILRSNIRDKTELGTIAVRSVAEGKLVGDGVVCQAIRDRVRLHDCRAGFILDGFPRTLSQAEFLESIWLSISPREQLAVAVVSLELEDETLLRRLRGRRICPMCSTTYNIETNPPQKINLCDHDESFLEVREDDQGAVSKRRVSDHRRTIAQIKEFYQSRYGLTEVNGSRSIKDVQASLQAVVTGGSVVQRL